MTFEINFEEKRIGNKNKGVALKIDMQRAELKPNVDEDEDLVEFNVHLIKNLRLVMKSFNRSSTSGVRQYILGASQNTIKITIF